MEARYFSSDKSDWTDFVNTPSVIRHGQIDFTKEVGGSFEAWRFRGEASGRQGRGGRMQIPEFLCRGLGRGGYLPVRRIKVAVFTIGNADRAAIVLPYKRPPGYMRTRPFFAKHNDSLCISSPRASQMSRHSLYAILCFDRAHLLKMSSTVRNFSNPFFVHCSKFFSFIRVSILWVGDIKRFQKIKSVDLFPF